MTSSVPGNMPAETWLVLGASSSVARAFARQVAAGGARVLLAGRDVADLTRDATDIAIRGGHAAEVVPFDATDTANHAAFAAACLARVAAFGGGRLNIFLAFGAMPAQADIDGDWNLARLTIETNYVGAVSILSALAPALERQGSGHVIVLGSVAGDRGRIKNYVYGSAKAGLHAYLEGYRARLFRSGVSVTTVKPGFLDTAMTWVLPLRNPASPDAAARHCLKAARRGTEETYFPPIWWPIMTIVRHIPAKVMKRLSF